MHKSRRIAAIFALATATAGLTATATAAPAAAAPFRGPQPVTTWLRPVPANVSSWVDIAWRTDRPICDAQVQVRGERVRVDYLGNRRGALFSRGATLTPRRADVTRIRVTPYSIRGGIAKLWATISYDECGWRTRNQTRTTVLSLPVLRNTSPDGHDGPGGPGHGHSGEPTGHGGPGQGGHDHGGPSQGGADPGGDHQGGTGHDGPGQGGAQQGDHSHGGPGQGGGHH
jgi:hypothetical protein